MNKPRIVLLESHEERLVDYLESDEQGHERAAVVLFRRLNRAVDGLVMSDRYLSVEVIPFEKEWISSSSSTHIQFELKFLREIFRRCEEESLVFGFIHNHPTGFPDFSDTDEKNECTLIEALKNRNGPKIHLVALLRTNGEWKGRVREGKRPGHVQTVRHIIIPGRPFKIYGCKDGEVEDEGISSRQSAAFGQPFVNKCRSLRVGVVGAGGTGSPTVLQLARAGVGEVVVIDNDTLEQSNLNRVQGAGLADVGKYKAQILQDYINGQQLPTKAVAINTLIDQDPLAIDALSSCDVIYGCTDDQIGREILNTAVYVYAQPYIDVGLGGQVSEDKEGKSYLRYHFGRVSTILPEQGECLFCQGVLKDVWIRHQYALRDNPYMAEAEAQERYLEGGNEQAPGVGPFTGTIANYGVATLYDLISPYRKFPEELRKDFFRIDFVKMELRSNQEKNDEECVYCRKREYLLLNEQYRLNRPSLGKVDVAV